jgi:hypothetical protein
VGAGRYRELSAQGLAQMPFRANDGERVGCDDFPGVEVVIAIGVRSYHTCERDTRGRV